MRYAVRHRCNPDEYLGAACGRSTYNIVDRAGARVWLRKADALRAAQLMGSAQIIGVELSFLTLSGVTQVCE